MEPSKRRQRLNEELIGLELGLTDAASESELASRLGSEAAVSRGRAAVRQALAPLASDSVGALGGLEDRILAKIRHAGQTLPFPQPARELATDLRSGSGRGGAMIALRELVGLAAAILVFVGVFVPGYTTARSRSQQQACLNNFRQIGLGLENYQASFGSYWPFAGTPQPNASWYRNSPPEIPRLSNSQAGYKLVSGNFVKPQAFICAGRPNDHPVDASVATQLNDFPDLHNISYSMNLITRPVRQSTFQPNQVTWADMTPLLDDSRLIQVVLQPMNSQSHRRLNGQNFLRADMSAAWSNTPKVGIDQDDIYQIAGVDRYTGMERPQSQADAFLVP